MRRTCGTQDSASPTGRALTDSGSKRTLLFEKADLHLELQVDDGGSQSACKLRPIMAAAKMLNRCKEELRRFVQVDGDVFYLPSM